MSKRHGAMSVIGYRDAGYLPEAVLNYLARLGWSHGDAEVFSREQFIEWFDLDHLGKSPAQYDHNKLNWLNNHYIKEADNARLAELAKPFFTEIGIADAALAQGPDTAAVIGLMKDRANTIKEIVENAAMFYRTPAPEPEAVAQHLTDAVRPALAELATALRSCEWTKEGVAAALKATLARAQAQDAAACDARALARRRHNAHAVDRCRAGAVRARVRGEPHRRRARCVTSSTRANPSTVVSQSMQKNRRQGYLQDG